MDIITRRQFLIGSLYGISAITLDRFIAYFENHGEPFLEATPNPDHTLFISKGQDYQIGLNQDPVCFKFPKMSLIDFLVEYNQEKRPETALELEYFEEEYGYSPKDLSAEVPIDLWYENASRISPSADAHTYLKSLEIEHSIESNDPRFGGLVFYDGPTIGSDYLGVHAEDEISISLLQRRLRGLGHQVSIKLV